MPKPPRQPQQQTTTTQDIHHQQEQSSASLPTELVSLDSLTPHPRNYQTHPDDELAHIMESIREHGFYRNVVITRDGIILAGHGVTEAAKRLGYTHIPAIRVDYAPDDPRALKLLVSDNEIRHLAEVDDRALSELLRELNSAAELLGTGYDEMMLANLAMVTRHASEIADLQAAAQWVGMPEYDERGDQRIQLTVNFATEDDFTAFYRFLGLSADAIIRRGASRQIWWPQQPTQQHDYKSVLFTTDHVGDSDE